LNKTEEGAILIYLILMIIGFLVTAGAVAPSLIRLQQVEQAKKTAVEVAYIQDAALWRKKDMGTHASSCSQLVTEGRLPSWFNCTNPFGNIYDLDTSTGQVVVGTTVPSSVSNVLVELLPNTTVIVAGENSNVSSNAKSP